MEKTRQLENIAANLDDISLTLEEIKDAAAQGESTSAKALDKIEADVTRAADAIDEAVDSSTAQPFRYVSQLADVQRIATEVAAEENPDLQVDVTSSQGESAYIELILTLTGCSVEPCRTLIGIDRDMSEPQFRIAVQDQLRLHLVEHRQGGVGLK